MSSPAYIPDPSQSDATAAARATALGVGIAPRAVPPAYLSVVTATPGVILDNFYIHDDGTLTSASVASAIAPIQAAAAAAASAAATASTNLQTILQRSATAISNNATYLAIASPTNAQVVAQVTALTRQMNGIIRMVVQDFTGAD